MGFLSLKGLKSPGLLDSICRYNNYNNSIGRLLDKVSEFERRGMQISHVRSVSKPLNLGRLQGNHFDLVIRDLKPYGKSQLTELQHLVKEAVENVKVNICSPVIN